MIKPSRRARLVILVLAFLLLAGAVFAQTRNLGPSSTEILNMHQVQALRAQLVKLHVELTACRDELVEVRKQLALCERKASGDFAPLPPAPTSTDDEKK